MAQFVVHLYLTKVDRLGQYQRELAKLPPDYAAALARAVDCQDPESDVPLPVPEPLSAAQRSALSSAPAPRLFEVLVGNDNPGRTLSRESLGLEDSRIRWINHPQNLGELGNMNALLKKARGRYFTWLADDDYYSPTLLESVLGSLRQFGFPSCVYTSYALLDDTGVGRTEPDRSTNEARFLAGREFLRKYLDGELRAIGSCGFFETGCLRGSGGAEKLGEGPFALYTEYLLLVKAGVLEKVAYIDTPLVAYRVHGTSWGCSNRDFAEYEAAARQLVRRSAEILRDKGSGEDFRRNMAGDLQDPLEHVRPEGLGRGRRIPPPLRGSLTPVPEGRRGEGSHRYPPLRNLGGAGGSDPGTADRSPEEHEPVHPHAPPCLSETPPDPLWKDR